MPEDKNLKLTEKERKQIELKGHPYWLALMRWAIKHPYSEITIKFQDSIPTVILKPTNDSLGKETVLIEDLVRRG